MGLMDVILHPDFENNRLVYFSYFAPPQGERGNGIHESTAEWAKAYLDTTALHDEWKVKDEDFKSGNPFDRRYIGRGRLADDEMSIENFENIFEVGARRMTFGADGKLWVTTWGTEEAQDQTKLGSKMLRLNYDGSIPDDNPFIGNEYVPDAIYASGFCDPSGTALNPETHEVWTIEHGPQGGDKINVMRAGTNYGRDYDDAGTPIGEGLSAKPGYEQPLYFWNPNIAPSSIMFYDGALYIVTDSWENGQLIKLTPRVN